MDGDQLMAGTAGRQHKVGGVHDLQGTTCEVFDSGQWYIEAVPEPHHVPFADWRGVQGTGRFRLILRLHGANHKEPNIPGGTLPA